MEDDFVAVELAQILLEPQQHCLMFLQLGMHRHDQQCPLHAAQSLAEGRWF